MRSQHVTTFIIFMAIVICAIGCGPPFKAPPSGQIAGLITDKETGEPVIGATVMLPGTQLGAMTDLDGQYTIEGVPPGVYTVKMSSVEYETAEVADVVVKIDQTTVVSRTLERAVVDLDNVISG